MTSNQYSHLLKPFSILFNKYWKGQTVTALCYDIPDVELPDNFKIISIGKQSEYWSNALITFFKSIDDKYFIINLEDMFLVDFVDNDKVRKLENEIKVGRADKACLHFYKEGKIIERENDIVEFKQDVLYRTSIHPAIWTKEYWLRHLKPNQTLWDFEKQHDLTKHDGARIICLKEQKCPSVLFNTSNMYIEGRIQPTGFELKLMPESNGLIYSEDIEIVKEFKKSKEV